MRALPALLALALALPAAAQTRPDVPARGDAGTFDVASWNLEQFGDPSNGPNDTFQLLHAEAVIEQAEIDLWGLQEIERADQWDALVANLADTGWAAVRGPQVSGSTTFDLRLAFVYDPDVVAPVSIGTILPGFSFEFAGRLPLEMVADVTVGGRTERMTIIDIHAKAQSDCCGPSSSYGRRAAAAAALKDYTDARLAEGQAVIVLGDFNDRLDGSISSGQPSPYAPFIDDADDYRGATIGVGPTFCGSNNSCSSGATIDNILYTQPLFAGFAEGDRYAELTTALPQYTSTTSDHLPVLARFAVGAVAAEPGAAALGIALSAPAPNPVRGTARLTATLDAPAAARLEIVDALGRTVAVLADGPLGAGPTAVAWDASGAAPGLYVARLTTPAGAVAQTLAVAR